MGCKCSSLASFDRHNILPPKDSEAEPSCSKMSETEELENNLPAKDSEADETASKISETTDWESKLRANLSNNPNSCMLNAQLSIVLSDKSTGEDDEIKKEAVFLARKAVSLGPNRPVGHLALSQCLSQHSDRMSSLKKAIDAWHPKCAMNEEAFAHALIRLLLEPRKEEKRQLSASGHEIPNTSPEHPHRRDLSAEESNLYERILESLNNVWSKNSESEIDKLLWLVHSEHQLGMFFRKLMPSEKHLPRCLFHLTNAEKRMPANHGLKKSYQFWLATVNCNASKVVERCPEAYVVNLYSTFAETFDKQLVNKLEYQTPTKLREMVDSIADDTIVWERAIDLGCGTGLSGSAFRDRVKYLIGVDLSPAMIAKADERRCYDELHVGELSTMLANQDEFDLLFSCDVFVYIGDLLETFKSAKYALKEGGLFAFSTEFLEEEMAGDSGYCVQTCARFAHKQSYIEELSERVGFAILKFEICSIRKNAGKYVQGILVVLQKPA